MQIIHLTTDTVKAGRTALRDYQTAVLCGPEAHIYVHGMSRRRGIAIIPGAILQCIEQGLNTANAILNAVARASHCRKATVQSVLNALTGEDAERHLWVIRGGRFQALQHGMATPNALLAA